ncbi:hypothetical protein FRB95_006221 [Tulasnella sp. JGI-2019a]|nr:hypothetical protein FRB95_006221 [Tulasnella sp. JGI-2019a]
MSKIYRRRSSQSAVSGDGNGECAEATVDQEAPEERDVNLGLRPGWRPAQITQPPTCMNTPYHSNVNSRLNLPDLALPAFNHAIHEQDEEPDPNGISFQVPTTKTHPSGTSPLRSRWQEATTTRSCTLPTAPTASHLKFTLTGPNSRFKSIVLKVIALNRMRLLSDEEPGVQDPSSDAAAAVYGHIKEKCSINIVDCGPTFANFVDLSTGGAEALEEFIKVKLPEDNVYGPGAERPLWSKIRWIDIGGVSWDVIKCLALRYHLHPLAIEDILHSRQTYSSRADYYQKHLFIRVLSHTLVEENSPPATLPLEPEDEDHEFCSTLCASACSSQSTILADTEKRAATMKGGGGLSTELLEMKKAVRSQARKYSHHLSSMFESNFKAGHRASTTQATVNELKREERVAVRLRNLYIALFRDGTLITIHQDPHTTFFQPIWTRLRQRDSLLRSSGDASLLLQHIIDLVVDNAVHIVDRYHEQLLKFERDILIKPKVSTVKYLHIASGDITMHKRTLAPLKSLVYGLRRYDLDRVMALRPGVHAQQHYEEGATGVKDLRGRVVVGFMSPKSKIYLADVLDHVEYILASLEMFESITENLIAYTFNVVSYDMNTTMRTLTIATVTFFPPTLLTGYFGMNFPDLQPIQARGNWIFWALAIPIVILIILIFSAPRLSEFMSFVKKKRLVSRVIKTRGRGGIGAPAGGTGAKCCQCGGAK